MSRWSQRLVFGGVHGAHKAGEALLDGRALAIWRRALWRGHHKRGWDGWAVEMIRAGCAEPALVGPWTMGAQQ
ncbi:hypothetical protein DDK22_11260 [Cupriavidus necator]|uniref:Uncharacterized protein n=1 Tax=Cupriavidus necator TaxID=106590 RepID=A0A367PKA7_CUPNE|nr:hypothetical protein DDK22_11260 [Cupriavidus necator]